MDFAPGAREVQAQTGRRPGGTRKGGGQPWLENGTHHGKMENT